MARSTFLRFAFLAALALVWGLGSGVEGAPRKSEDVVKVKAKADKPDADGKQTITVTFTMDKGWHIYANPIGNADFAGNETVVSVAGKQKLEDVKVEYPTGKLEKTGDISMRIYEDKVAVKITLKRAKDDNGPLEVTAKINACDANSCLPGSSVKVPVE